MLFALLMGTTLVIVRLAVPSNQTDSRAWLADPYRRDAVRLACQFSLNGGATIFGFVSQKCN
jgi:hypothetical protein